MVFRELAWVSSSLSAVQDTYPVVSLYKKIEMLFVANYIFLTGKA
jgi:hypothetical protein